MDFVVFGIKGERYGIDISRVREVVELSDVMPVPETPEYILGVTNLRGEVIPVVDLALRLGLGRSCMNENSKLVVVEGKDYKAALLVDGLPDVLHPKPEEVSQQLRSLNPKIDTELIWGAIEGEYVLVIDIDRLFSAGGE